MRKALSLVLVAGPLLLGVTLSGETRAGCACHVNRAFASHSFPDRYSYIYTPGVVAGPETTTISGELKGAFWMLGHGVPGPDPCQGVDNGRFEAIVASPSYPGYYGYDGWIRSFPFYGAYIHSNWGDSPDVDRCPDVVMGQRCMAILLTDEVDGNGYFAFLTDEADAAGHYDFVQAGNAPINLTEIPEPAILGNVYHNNGADFGLLIGGPDPDELAAGLYRDPACLALGDVVGYRIYSFSQPSGAPPPITRDRELWTAETGTMEFGTTFTLPFDCSGAAPEALDVYLALGLVFESGFELHVSRNSTRVACGATIAAPDDADLKPRRMPRRKTKR